MHIFAAIARSTAEISRGTIMPPTPSLSSLLNSPVFLGLSKIKLGHLSLLRSMCHSSRQSAIWDALGGVQSYIITLLQLTNYIYMKGLLSLACIQIFVQFYSNWSVNWNTVRPWLSGHNRTRAYPDKWFGRIWEICINTESSVGLNTSYNVITHCYSICNIWSFI